MRNSNPEYTFILYRVFMTKLPNCFAICNNWWPSSLSLLPSLFYDMNSDRTVKARNTDSFTLKNMFLSVCDIWQSVYLFFLLTNHCRNVKGTSCTSCKVIPLWPKNHTWWEERLLTLQKACTRTILWEMNPMLYVNAVFPSQQMMQVTIYITLKQLSQNSRIHR